MCSRMFIKCSLQCKKENILSMGFLVCDFPFLRSEMNSQTLVTEIKQLRELTAEPQCI